MVRHTRVVFVFSLFFFVFFVYDRPWPKGTHGSPWSDQLPFERNPSFLIRARNGAVASENKRCSDIGVDVLKDGGNAVDAAIASTFCIGVVNMFS
jgi:gamma-glutamyltranspeptidase/glutathione hydrolase/leukotriene-C4 hydrolase